jgi:carotenoid cleavage dioxygenase-like enzyme
VGNPSSDEGVVICQEFDSRTLKSHFLLFDAHSVGTGPTARLTLDHSLYLGFHAAFRAEPAKP